MKSASRDVNANGAVVMVIERIMQSYRDKCYSVLKQNEMEKANYFKVKIQLNIYGKIYVLRTVFDWEK